MLTGPLSGIIDLELKKPDEDWIAAPIRVIFLGGHVESGIIITRLVSLRYSEDAWKSVFRRIMARLRVLLKNPG